MKPGGGKSAVPCMAKRSISFTDNVDYFFNTYERRLCAGGYSLKFISEVAMDIYLAIFENIPAAQLPVDPTYLGLDPTMPGYSRYSFTHGTIHGSYISIGDHVIVDSINIRKPELPQVAAAQTSAA